MTFRTSPSGDRLPTLTLRWLRRTATAALVAGGAGAFAAPPAASPPPTAGVTDRLIVKYRQAAAPQAPAEAAIARTVPAPATQALEAVRKTRLNQALGESTFLLTADRTTSFGARVVSLGRTAGTDEVQRLAQRLMAVDPEIEYAVPDRFIYLAQVPNDPRYAAQWPLHDAVSGVRAPGGWLVFNLALAHDRRDRDFPLVAIVDTGYRPHVDLPKPDFIRDYLTGSPVPLDTGDGRTEGQCANVPSPSASSWHGLTVEGIIAARLGNGVGVAGLAAQGAGIAHARVFGPCGGYLSDYIAAIHDAVDFRNARGQRVRVINLSQAGAAPCEAPLQAEVSRAVAAGVVVVASAGNSAAEAVSSSPANCQGAIAVAATDRDGNLAYYSNRGPGLTLAAPGGDSYTHAFSDGVLSTWLNLPGTEPTGQQASDYNYVQGTSFSAPHVSATAALMINLDPTLTPPQVKKILSNTARPVPGNCAGGCGAGLLDVRRALERVELRKIAVQVCARWPSSLPMCRGGDADD